MRKAIALSVLLFSLLVQAPPALAGYDKYNVGGYWADKRGDKEKAIELWKQSIEYNERSGKPNQAVGLNCNNVAGVYRELKKWGEAEPYYLKAADTYQKIGKLQEAGASLFYAGQCQYNLGKWAEAEKSFSDSLPMYDQKNGKLWATNACNWLAYSQYNQTRYQQALSTLDDLSRRRAQLKGKQNQADIGGEWVLKGQCLGWLNQAQQAQECIQKGLDLLKSTEPRPESRIAEANKWLDWSQKQLAANATSAPKMAPVTTPAAPAQEVVEQPAPPAAPAKAKVEETGLNRPIKDKWALVIGISQFKHPEYNLKFAAKDAQDFKTFLTKECNFTDDHVKLLVNDQATRQNIMSAFGDTWLPRVAMPDDLVVIYVSTHGTPSTRDLGKKNYLVAFDTDRDELFGTGVNMNDLCSQIKDRVNTDRVLIVMDTCYSGAAASGARGLERPDNFDAEQIAQGAGRLVISSSSPNEQSWESKEYQNGIFTHNLIECLRKENHQVDILSAFNELKKSVQWEVQSNYGVPQTPILGGKWDGIVLKLGLPPAERRQVPAALRKQ